MAKKQGQKDKEDEKLGMEVKGLKDKAKKKGKAKAGGWIAHVKRFAAKNKISYKDALSKASASYKKK